MPALRVQIPQVREEAWVEELMWNDPRARGSGLKDNTRGEGVFEFGADVTKKFLQDNNLRMVIRAHDIRKEGSIVRTPVNNFE